MVVVSAPSGAGKTSLCREAARRVSRLVHSVSYTTRAPRPDEQDGRDYHFVDEPTFRRMIEAGEFAEWACVHNHLYGTSRSLLEKQFAEGLDVILDIDTQGAAKLRQDYPTGVFVFVVPPAMDLLETRLRQRRTDSEDEIRRRLAMAREEAASLP
ncbi:MAG: guanylate kinase [Candidatus Methylomirabilis sp.]|nr:guanylate kinase [Candidatus Methylomirabilis sp.]